MDSSSFVNQFYFDKRRNFIWQKERIQAKGDQESTQHKKEKEEKQFKRGQFSNLYKDQSQKIPYMHQWQKEAKENILSRNRTKEI